MKQWSLQNWGVPWFHHLLQVNHSTFLRDSQGGIVDVLLTMISPQSTWTGCRNHPVIWKHTVMVERGSIVLSVLLRLCFPMTIPQQFFLYEARLWLKGEWFHSLNVFTDHLMPHSLCLLFLQWGAPFFPSQILKDHLQSTGKVKVSISTFLSLRALFPLCFKADHWKVHRWQSPDWGGDNTWFSESTLHLLIWSLAVEEICWDAQRSLGDWSVVYKFLLEEKEV